MTQTLVAEHRVFNNLFDHVEHVLPSVQTLAEVRLLSRLVEALLRRHAAKEEDLVLVAMDHLHEHRAHSDRFHHEHQEIDAGLKQAQTARRLASARQLLRKAVRTSRAHFAREERTIFPLLELALPRTTLQRLRVPAAPKRRPPPRRRRAGAAGV